MILRNVATKQDWNQIIALYGTAFPKNERKPMQLIRAMYQKKKADVWVIEKDEGFSGFAITMNADDLVLLDYFAISDGKRGAGVGTEALRKLQEYYIGKRFFLEIESVYNTTADNLSERIHRKGFYLRNRMTEMQVKAKVFGVEMELLGYDCRVSFAEYQSVYWKNYGEWAAKKIQEVLN